MTTRKKRFAIAAMFAITGTIWNTVPSYGYVDTEGVLRNGNKRENDRVLKAYKNYVKHENDRLIDQPGNDEVWEMSDQAVVGAFIQYLCSWLEGEDGWRGRVGVNSAEEARKMLKSIYEDGSGFGIKLVDTCDGGWENINKRTFEALASRMTEKEMTELLNRLWLGSDARDMNVQKASSGKKVGDEKSERREKETRKALALNLLSKMKKAEQGEWMCQAINSSMGGVTGNSRGLTNIGNTCYMNASLQALYGAKALREKILEYKDKGGFLGALADLFEDMGREKDEAISEKDMNLYRNRMWETENDKRSVIYELLEKGKNKQQDGEEFVGAVLAALKDKEKTLEGRTEVKIKKEGNCNLCKKGREIGERVGEHILRVEIGENSGRKLIDMIEESTKEKMVDGAECGKCQGKIYERKEKYEYLPGILVIQLKRFKDIRRGGIRMWEKISDKVNYAEQIEIPENLLDDKIKRERYNYKLIGVIKHDGRLGGGHYTADVLKEEDGKWYTHNDGETYLSGRTGSFSVDSDAYVLVYERKKD
ncbi:MAG: ubiquitin carboxyl-terminal hydrolase [Holosporaceae bacterium]|jgi:ubiquitin C-terminal hydrolase|nr:ubiquitin carboxyl-terminal hydrolase [Holosporaceae bacterium]